MPIGHRQPETETDGVISRRTIFCSKGTQCKHNVQGTKKLVKKKKEKYEFLTTATHPLTPYRSCWALFLFRAAILCLSK